MGRSFVYTDENGLATPAWWQAGDTAAVNTLVASVSGLAPVVFTAAVRRRMIAQFDLRVIGSDTLPPHIQGSGQAVVGGHYVLFDDGSATFGYDVAFVTPTTLSPLPGVISPMRYVLTGQLDGEASIAFYEVRGGVPELNVFSSARIVDGVMTVTYTDTVDFDTEIYQLAR